MEVRGGHCAIDDCAPGLCEMFEHKIGMVAEISCYVSISIDRRTSC